MRRSLRRARHLGHRGPTFAARFFASRREVLKPLTGKKLRSKSEAAACAWSIVFPHILQLDMAACPAATVPFRARSIVRPGTTSDDVTSGRHRNSTPCGRHVTAFCGGTGRDSGWQSTIRAELPFVRPELQLSLTAWCNADTLNALSTVSLRDPLAAKMIARRRFPFPT
jgi:hypothetical protein